MFRAKLRTLVCKPPVNCSVTHKPLDNKNNGTCYDCYQFVIKRLIEIAETRINTGFFKQLDLFKLHFEFVICHDFPTLFIKNTTFYTELSTMSPLSPNKNHHLPTTDLIHHHLDNRSSESQTTAASVLLFPRPNSISYHLPQTDMKHHQEFQL